MKLTKKALSLVLAIALLVTLAVIPAQATGNTVNGFTAYATGGLVGGTTYDTNITLSNYGGTDRVMVTGRGGTNYGDTTKPRSTMGVYSESSYALDGLEILYSVESWVQSGDHWYAIALMPEKGEWFENDGSDRALFFLFAYDQGYVTLNAHYVGNGAAWTNLGKSQGVPAAGGQYSIRLHKASNGYEVYMKNASQSDYTLLNFGGITALPESIVTGLLPDETAYLTAGAYVATYEGTWSFVLGAHAPQEQPPVVEPQSENGFTAFATGGLVGGTTYDPNIQLDDCNSTDRVKVTGRGGTNYGDTTKPRSTMGVYSEKAYALDGLEILYSVESWVQSGDHWYAIALSENNGEWFENDGSDKALFFMFGYENGTVVLQAHHIGNGAGWSYIGKSQGVPAAGGQYSIYLKAVDGGYSAYMKNASQTEFTLQNFGGTTVLPASIVDGLFPDGEAYLMAGAYVATYAGTWSFVLGAHEGVTLPEDAEAKTLNGFTTYLPGGLVGGRMYDPDIQLEDCGGTDRVKVTGRGGTNYGDTTKPRSTMGVYSENAYALDGFAFLYSVEDWIPSGDHWYAIALMAEKGEWFEDDGSDRALFFQFAYNNGNVTLAAHHIGNGAGGSYIGKSQDIPAAGGQYSIYLKAVEGGYSVYMKNAEQTEYTLLNFEGTTVLPASIVDGLFPDGEAYLTAGGYAATYEGTWSFILGVPCAHKNTILTGAVAATCTEPGYTGDYVCEDCGETVTYGTVIDPLGHDYQLTGWTWNGVTSASACFTCARDASHVETVEATITSVRTEPTAEENGSVVYTASVTFMDVKYTDTKTEILPALGHDYVFDGWNWSGYDAAAIFIDENGGDPLVLNATVTTKRIEPTCTETGAIIYTATVTFNGTDYTDQKTETLPAFGHDLHHIDAKAPTCTEIGWDAYDFCTRCDYSTYTEIAALGHDLVRDDPVAATCTATGLTAGEHCTRCDYKVAQETVPALGHDLVRDAPVAATCTATGLTAGEHCSRCDYKVAQEETPALGHDWDEGKVTTEPTATKDGVKTFTCKRCGETRTEAIPATGVKDNPFKDVKEGEYYYDAVLWAVNANPQVTSGTSKTTFSPNDTCTRAQVVTFLWRAKGCPEPKANNNPFKDVKASDYYYKAVLWAVENNVTAGTSTTTFSPNDGCTRAQVVTFLWRAEGQPKPTSSANPFKDVTGGYYYDAVLWAVEKNITAGTSKTTFSPNNTCTRGQIVTFLYRAVAG